MPFSTLTIDEYERALLDITWVYGDAWWKYLQGNKEVCNVIDQDSTPLGCA